MTLQRHFYKRLSARHSPVGSVIIAQFEKCNRYRKQGEGLVGAFSEYCEIYCTISMTPLQSGDDFTRC